MSAPKHADRNLVTNRLADVVQVFRDQALGDAAMLEASKRGAELESTEEAMALLADKPEKLAAQGWTRRELLVAMHASKPKSEAPSWLLFAQERHVTRMKTLPTEGGDGKGKGAAFYIPADVIDVAEDDEGNEP